MKELIESYVKRIEPELFAAVPKKDGLTETIYKAMSYSLEAGGKRLRPVIMLMFAKLFGLPEKEVMPFACAIEMIDVYKRQTMYLPEDDNSHTTRNDLLVRIAVALGGRAAESIVLDDITTGASQDIKTATHLAHEMVTKFGMSDSVGLVCYDDGEEVFLGRDLGHSKTYSESVAGEIDREIRKIISTQYNTAVNLLNERRAQLDAVAAALLEKETIDGPEFNKIIDMTA